jgi:adenosine deaminase
MTTFSESLSSLDLKGVQNIPKSDLHNHCMLGGRLKQLEKFFGEPLPKFSQGHLGVSGINEWISNVYRKVLDRPGALQAAVDAAFMQARSDGVTLLEMSIDITLGKLLQIRPENLVTILKEAHHRIAPEIDYRPELGIPRILSIRSVFSNLEPYLESGYFRAIDLYDLEAAQPVKNFAEIYRFARNSGLRCKAHAGEFGDAKSVREAVEVLGLDDVQHGIGAADSPEVMRWLADNKIRLNVCPASNIALKRIRTYKSHPLRILFDHGVKVTVNTDDVMLFDKGNSEQFLSLYKCGLFSAEELNTIRRNGFETP